MTHSEFVKLLFELYPVCPVCGENWLIHETENIATCACCEKEIIEQLISCPIGYTGRKLVYHE